MLCTIIFNAFKVQKAIKNNYSFIALVDRTSFFYIAPILSEIVQKVHHAHTAAEKQTKIVCTVRK